MNTIIEQLEMRRYEARTERIKNPHCPGLKAAEWRIWAVIMEMNGQYPGLIFGNKRITSVN